MKTKSFCEERLSIKQQEALHWLIEKRPFLKYSAIERGANVHRGAILKHCDGVTWSHQVAVKLADWVIAFRQ